MLFCFSHTETRLSPIVILDKSWYVEKNYWSEKYVSDSTCMPIAPTGPTLKRKKLRWSLRTVWNIRNGSLFSEGLPCTPWSKEDPWPSETQLPAVCLTSMFDNSSSKNTSTNSSLKCCHHWDRISFSLIGLCIRLCQGKIRVECKRYLQNLWHVKLIRKCISIWYDVT